LLSKVAHPSFIGILASIAYPSYQEYVIRAKRGDGKAAILSEQLAQEKWRANNTTYNSTVTNSPSPDGYYTLAVTDTSATAYTITATPTGSHSDAKCTTLVIDQDGTKTATGTDSSNCWSK